MSAEYENLMFDYVKIHITTIIKLKKKKLM